MISFVLHYQENSLRWNEGGKEDRKQEGRFEFQEVDLENNNNDRTVPKVERENDRQLHIVFLWQGWMFVT